MIYRGPGKPTDGYSDETIAAFGPLMNDSSLGAVAGRLPFSASPSCLRPVAQSWRRPNSNLQSAAPWAPFSLGRSGIRECVYFAWTERRGW